LTGIFDAAGKGAIIAAYRLMCAKQREAQGS
jgi:hypothetical protein